MPFSFGLDIGSAISGIAGAQAQAQANAIAQQNLQFQKEQARKQYGLATAARTDAYGNKVSFDDILDEWLTTLSPTQQQLMKAGEHEQMLSLTEDAGRNRDKRRRAGERAHEAETDYRDAVSDYRYNEPPKEEETFGELARLITDAQNATGKEAQHGIGMQALRLGKGADIPSIIKSTDDMLGQQVPNAILQARNAALSETQSRNQAHNATYLPRMQHFAQVEDAVGDGPLLFSGAPDWANATQGQMLNSIAAALANGAAGVGNAYGQLASVAGQSPRFGGMSAQFSSGGEDQSKGYTTVGAGQVVIDPRTGQVIYASPYNPYATGGKSGGSTVGTNEDVTSRAADNAISTYF